jgi:polyisoprenoid-binding protein YceI
VDKTGLGHQHGVEANLLAGRLILGAQENAGTLVIDMTSFKADTAMARKYVGLSGTTDESTRKKVTDNMLGASVLNATQFPTATYEIASAKATGQTSSQGLPSYELIGQFTLHGVTRPLRIAASVEQARGWLHLRGGFQIKQSDYGITPFSKAFGAIGVADELKIYGDLFVAPTDQIAMTDIPERK